MLCSDIRETPFVQNVPLRSRRPDCRNIDFLADLVYWVTSRARIRCQKNRWGLIASPILLCPSASRALDKVTLVTDFGYKGRHAFFFDALDRGYYRDAGLEVKIVRSEGAVDAIRQVGAGNATFGFADAGT